MISPATIQKIRELAIVPVIERYIPLKRQGAHYKALSPWTSEKTPSFTVNPVKNFWWDFSAGHGGDALAFVIRYRQISFQEAVEEIARDEGIQVEREDLDPERAEELRKQKAEQDHLRAVLEYAQAWFLHNPVPGTFLNYRRFKADTIHRFAIGYGSSQDGSHLWRDAQKAGIDLELLKKAGLVWFRPAQDLPGDGPERPGTGRDAYSNRIVFPIHDHNGQLVAFSARIHTTAIDEIAGASPSGPKYLNSPEQIWVKGDHLYGLHLAKSAIDKEGFAYLVEGPTDAQRMFQCGFPNTVAIMTSSLCEAQIRLLRRFCSRVCLVPDNDRQKDNNPGMAAMHRNARQLLQAGFKVDVLIPGYGSGEKTNTDPDAWLAAMHTTTEIQEWLRSRMDYAGRYMVNVAMAQAEAGPSEKAQAYDSLVELLAGVSDLNYQAAIYTEICKTWTYFRDQYRKKVFSEAQKKQAESARSSESVIDKYRKTDEKSLDFYTNGYFIDGDAICVKRDGQDYAVSNFTLEFKFYIRYMDQNKYVVRLTNNEGFQTVIPVRADIFASVQDFEKFTANLYRMAWWGSKDILRKLRLHGTRECPIAVEISRMGWMESENCWVFAQGLYRDGKMFCADKYGVVTLEVPITKIEEIEVLKSGSHLIVEDKREVVSDLSGFFKKYPREVLQEHIQAGKLQQHRYYFLPFSTSFSLGEGEEGSEKKYQHQRAFRYVPSEEISFEGWSERILAVYGTNGRIMVAYTVATIFRDLIFQANNNYFPILSHSGPKQTGKSKAAESIMRVFMVPTADGINLEGGSTFVAMTRIMESSTNGMVWLNEYKDSLDMKILALIKNSADGGGKFTGIKTTDLQTRSYENHNGVILVGQDVPTKDPAVFSRVIPLEFKAENRNYEAFDELKRIEQSDVCPNVLCELLQYRPLLRKYREYDSEIGRELRRAVMERQGFRPEDRTVLNLISILAPVKILMEHADLKFPFTYEEVFDQCCQLAGHVRSVQDAMDDVEQFLSVLQSLDGRVILHGEHYLIRKEPDHSTSFFLRLRSVIGHYKDHAKRQGLVPLAESTITNYFRQHKAYIPGDVKKYNGQWHNVQFDEGLRTNAFRFDYEIIRDMGFEFKGGYAMGAAALNGKENGSLSGYIARFLEKLPTSRQYELAELHRQFAEEFRGLQLSRQDFIEALDDYMGKRERLREILPLDSELNAVRISARAEEIDH